MENYRILANVKLQKLKEYSRSYGGVETIDVDFIHEYENEIVLFDCFGNHIRTMKKGTKLLVSFTGTPISERAYKIRVTKAKKRFEAAKEARQKEAQKKQAVQKALIFQQSSQLLAEFTKNKGFHSKLKNKIETSSSKNWRPWVKMKVCQKIANENFKDLHLSPAIIRDLIYKF